MSSLATLETGLLLRLYAMLAGACGVFWALAQLCRTSIFRRSAAAADGLHAVAVLTIVLWTPLELGWKCPIVGSSLVFLALPLITWRFLQHTQGDRNMIGNLLNVLVGLWPAYSAVFANPAGAMNNVALAGSAIAVIVFAV